MTRRMVIGDIHGRAKALKKVLALSAFDYEKDQLIILGDVSDGGFQTKQVISTLLKIKNRILITSNHDKWTLAWFKTGAEPWVWTTQGGRATMYSYGYLYRKVPKSHVDFLENTVDYYVDDKNNIFLHGSFDPTKPIGVQKQKDLIWKRDIIGWAITYGEIPGYNRVFIGHSSTAMIQKDRITPIIIDNLVMVDTAAGWDGGRLTIMDIDTLQYWQADVTE